MEPIAGSDLAEVTLTDEAAKRIDLQTATVAQGAGHEDRDPLRRAAVRPRRQHLDLRQVGRPDVRAGCAITVDHIEGDTAFLTGGPAVGTEVVTVGATQLYGAEQGVGEDE